MTTDPTAEEPKVSRATVLAVVEDLRTDLRGVRAFGKQTRRQTRVLYAVFFVDIVVTVLAVTGFVRVNGFARDNERLIDRVHQTAVQACEHDNETRRANLDVWNYVLTVPTTKGSAPPPPGVIDGFKAEVNQKLAPRDCGK